MAAAAAASQAEMLTGNFIPLISLFLIVLQLPFCKPSLSTRPQPRYEEWVC